jgi:hypothetical protein
VLLGLDISARHPVYRAVETGLPEHTLFPRPEAMNDPRNHELSASTSSFLSRRTCPTLVSAVHFFIKTLSHIGHGTGRILVACRHGISTFLAHLLDRIRTIQMLLVPVVPATIDIGELSSASRRGEWTIAGSHGAPVSKEPRGSGERQDEDARAVGDGYPRLVTHGDTR